MPGTAVKFKTGYNNYSPETIFQVDPGAKTLSPFGSGDAYTGAGYQFGQEQVVDPTAYAGFSVGPIINSRAAGLSQVTDQLNQAQNDTFNQSTAAPKRASSTLDERINAGTAAYEDSLSQFNSLVEKYKALPATNYQQDYNNLRAEQGVPALEKQFTDVRADRREMPYVQRSNTGNAGVATETQLGAQVAQNDIPLGIQEQNTLDRLKLAQDFINNSLALKQTDDASSRTALQNAITLLTQGISITESKLSADKAEKDKAQTRADASLQFRLDNDITTPFFNSGGTIYDAGSLEGITDEKTFQQKYGMTLQDAETKGLVGKLDGGTQQNKALVLDLASKYPDAGIVTSDSLSEAQAKLKNSRIYQEQVRPPSSGSGSGAGGGSFIAADGSIIKLTNQQIDNINPLVTAFQNSDITKNYTEVAEQANFVKSLGNTSTDDQARIYAFAKVMDPGSAVKEGEYKNVQEYSAALLQRYGLNAKRVFTNGGILTDEARGFLLKTIDSRVSSLAKPYNNLVKDTARRVELIGGLPAATGNKFLNDYSKGYAPVTPTYNSSFTGPTQGQQQTAPTQEAEEKKNQSTLSKITNFLWGSD